MGDVRQRRDDQEAMRARSELPIDSSALAALVRLRTMLERALDEAAGSSGPSRHIALVMLDGACEYAIRVCAHHRRLALKPETGFHASIESLRSGLAGWNRAGMRGVIELHAARNQAQHLGLLPDPETVPGWVRDATAFIEELVEVAFEVPLAEVMLAEAIRNADLRGLLSDAERALNAGDNARSFLVADQAFLQARSFWREQHGQASREDAGVGPSSAVLYTPTPSEPRDHLEVQVFASDMSRYTQLLTTRRHLSLNGPEPDETEARSALLFVFDWVLRWEVFNEGYPTQRYAEHWQSIGPPQLDEGGVVRLLPEYAVYRIETGAGQEDQYELIVRLANIPGRGRTGWGLDFSVALEAAANEFQTNLGIIFQALELNGALRVRVPVDADPDDLMAILNRATAVATERFESREQDMQASRLKAAELRERYSAVLREAATSGGVFGAVDVVSELTTTGIRYAVRLALLAPTPFDLNQATSVFNGQGEELAGTSHQDGKIVFEAFDLTGVALHRLREAISSTESMILHYRTFNAEKELERQQFARRVKDLLGVAAHHETA